MRVLGVDPGLGRTGVAIVDGRVGSMTLVEAACLETPAHTPDSTRLAMLFAAVENFIAAHAPETAAVEELFFSSNRTTAIQVAQARGVILLALARGGVAVSGYTPNEVKESVAGFGAARKPQVARMTKRLLGVDSIPGHDDAVDACAVAICHHHRAGLSGRRSDMGTGPAAGESGLDRAVALARARLGVPAS